MAVVIAANRTRHPLDARTLARLAAQYAGRGVVGFGLSNDERRGSHGRLRAGVPDRRAGRAAARRRTAASCAAPSTSRQLPRRPARRAARPRRPRRRGPGAAGPDRRRPASRSRSARSPTSRSASTPTSPRCRCRRCSTAGATVALGADDPLLFGSRLAGQYATMRAAHDLTDAQLAELARMSVRASAAPDDVRRAVLADIDAWLARTILTRCRHDRRAPTEPRTATSRRRPNAARPPAGSRVPSSPATPSSPTGTGQQPPHGYPAYQPQPPNHPSATTAMVLGIVGPGGLMSSAVASRWCCSPFAWFIGAKVDDARSGESPGSLRRPRARRTPA